MKRKRITIEGGCKRWKIVFICGTREWKRVAKCRYSRDKNNRITRLLQAGFI